MKKIFTNFLLILAAVTFAVSCTKPFEPGTDPETAKTIYLQVDAVGTETVVIDVNPGSAVTSFYVGYVTVEDFADMYNSDIDSAVDGFITANNPTPITERTTIDLATYFGALEAGTNYIIFAANTGVTPYEVSTVELSTDPLRITATADSIGIQALKLTYKPNVEREILYAIGNFTQTDIDMIGGGDRLEAMSQWITYLDNNGYLENFLLDSTQTVTFTALDANTEYFQMSIEVDTINSQFLSELFVDSVYTNKNIPTDPVDGDITLTVDEASITAGNATVSTENAGGLYTINVISITAWNDLETIDAAVAYCQRTLESNEFDLTAADGTLVFDADVAAYDLKNNPWGVTPTEKNMVLVYGLTAEGEVDDSVEPSAIFVDMAAYETDASATVDISFDPSTNVLTFEPSNLNTPYRYVVLGSANAGVTDDQIISNMNGNPDWAENFAVGTLGLRYALPAGNYFATVGFCDATSLLVPEGTVLTRYNFTAGSTGVAPLPQYLRGNDTSVMIPYAADNSAKMAKLPVSKVVEPLTKEQALQNVFDRTFGR